MAMKRYKAKNKTSRKKLKKHTSKAITKSQKMVSSAIKRQKKVRKY